MTFISYAQNLEDVLLWRALQAIEGGFYIDVGANDPVEDSVTKAFYDRGWHGINIEPLPAHQQRLCAERPRDINLALAAGAGSGELTLFDVPAVRGWASPNETVAAHHRSSGYEVTAMTVPVQPLVEICARHAPDEIHFLKVDVEGFEADVIRGMDFRRWRPWIVVVEATLPNSQISNHDLWEGMVTESGYRFVYFDGLNRYYVADEHQELVQAFATPPNVFDEFQTITQIRALDDARHATKRSEQAEAIAKAMAEKADSSARNAAARIAAAEQHVQDCRQALLAAQVHAEELQARLHAVNAHLHAIYSCKSWKLAAPLRIAGVVLQRVRGVAGRTSRYARPAAKRIVIALLRRTYPIIKQNPRLMNLVHHAYIRFPSLGERLKALVRDRPAHVPQNQTFPSADCVQDVRSAWEGSVSLRSQFVAMLARELEKRKNGKR